MTVSHKHLACRKCLSNSQPNPINKFGNQCNEVSVSTFSHPFAQGGDSSSVICLSSAREAISTLSYMVSNWSSVYNGVVWYVHISPRPLFWYRLLIKLIRQPLYCLFTPFSVVFGSIIHSDGARASAIAQDLNFLSATVDYSGVSCSRLGNERSILEKMFDWFSWETYYSGIEA